MIIQSVETLGDPNALGKAMAHYNAIIVSLLLATARERNAEIIVRKSGECLALMLQ